MLSAAQTKTILTTVVREHLVKLERVAALELADGIDAADGRRMDLITGWAMRLRAVKGPDAKIDAEDREAMTRDGLVDEDMADVRKTIVTFRDGVRDIGPPSAKILNLLESVQAPTSPGDVTEAQRLVQRAQAAALLAVDKRWSISALKDDNDLVDLANGSFSNAPPPIVSIEHHRVPASHCGATEVETQAVTATPRPSDIVTITSLSDRLISEKAATSEWRPKTQRQVRSVIALFVKMLGADDVSLIKQSAIADYKSLLLKLPKTYGKNPADFDRPLEDILKHAKTLHKREIGRHGSTLNRHLTQLKGVVEYVETCGRFDRRLQGVSKLRATVTSRPRNARAAYSPDEIKAVFKAPLWMGCASEQERLTQGSVIIHDALYFVPLLGKATLARREELCGLGVDDVGIEDGMPFIDIRPDEHRLLKNDQSARQIPLIEELIRLGFCIIATRSRRWDIDCSFPSYRPIQTVRPTATSFTASGARQRRRNV